MAILNQQYTALVIEDNPELAAMMVNTLMLMDITPYHAKNAQEALALLDKDKPALILFNIELEDMSTWEFVSILQERYEVMPALLTTAYRKNQPQQLFRIKHLMATIGQVLDQHHIAA